MLIFRTFSAHAIISGITRGDAFRCASRLPLAFISRAFGAKTWPSIPRLGADTTDFAVNVPASPPDVRRGSAPPLSSNLSVGLCPWSGLCPNISEARGRTGGTAQTFFLSLAAGHSPASHRAAKPGRRAQNRLFVHDCSTGFALEVTDPFTFRLRRPM